MNKERLLTILLAFLSVAMMTSCHHSDPIIEQIPEADHTLLIYMVADNNGMSKYCNSNIYSCMEGLKQAKQPLKLVIFKDTGRNPVLFQLKRNSKNQQKIDTLYIKKYDEYVNSVDKDFLAEVVNTAFEACPAKIKGFEYWSHGGSWIPERWTLPADKSRPATRASQYIGIDNYRYMQLWEFREALEKCPYLDYVAFDACNMATAEVAYELRKRCHYTLSSAQEIMGDGFAYSDMIVSLSKAGIVGIQESLKACVDDMGRFYPNNGSFSLVDSEAMEPLAQAYSDLLVKNSTFLESLRQDGLAIQADWQRYGGGNAANTIYYYYDLGELASLMGDDLKTQLASAVPYSYCATTYFSSFDNRYHAIKNFSGLAVSVPELFSLCKGNQYLAEGYHMTEWGRKMGY